jgi:acetyl-CoA carboxylase biotin carboxylase subunit
VFRRILIANRGEAAVRIVRACRELGIESVLVYSEIDADTLGVKLADRAVCIGPAPELDSYRNIPRVLTGAEIASCDAVHPGYGFLAENSEFAEAVETCNLGWIGPKSETIRTLNDRLACRHRMKEIGVPVLPGSDQEITSAADARRLADQIGYPIVFKPVVRSTKLWVVHKEKDLETTLRMAQGDSRATLNDARIYLERYLETCRALEVQILGTADGSTIQLFERECSIQHRHEKILEEAPSPMVTGELRRQLGDWAVRAAQAVKYRNAGTVQFLADEAGKLYYLGIHASLQPEHPVTEILVGCDLVAEQIRIAAGEAVSDEVRVGAALPAAAPHVIKCRINAEDAEKDFMPTSGVLTTVRLPGGPGVRVDTHVYSGYKGSALYDTLIAKISVWDTTRDRAIARMERALQETVLEGVKTTLELQQKLLRLGAFRKGELSTTLVGRELLGTRAGQWSKGAGE